MLLIITGSSICVAIRAVAFNLMAERIARALRKDFFESIVAKDVAFYDVRKSGDLISRMGSDIEVI
jgi:ABC-type bacteriocin/lantibiotic exporter with double-glycine peptidase domain